MKADERLDKLYEWVKHIFRLGQGIQEVRYISYLSASGPTVILILTDGNEEIDFSDFDLSFENLWDLNLFLCSDMQAITGVPGVIVEMPRSLHDYLVSPDSGSNKTLIVDEIQRRTGFQFPFTDWFAFTWADV